MVDLSLCARRASLLTSSFNGKCPRSNRCLRCLLDHTKQAARTHSAVFVSWFAQSKYASFKRQLNIYGFTRITSGTQQKQRRFERSKSDRTLTLRFLLCVESIVFQGKMREAISMNFFFDHGRILPNVFRGLRSSQPRQPRKGFDNRTFMPCHR